METRTYEVPNISCGHCVHTIQTELTELSGVSRVSADQQSRRVEVDYAPPATDESVRRLLAEIDYPAA